VSARAIRVEGLGKLYRLGGRPPYLTLREALMGVARAPARIWRRLRGKETRAGRFLWALREVSFEVGRGEVVGIIGRNGSGKSTLLKILSRITEPTEGRAAIRGRVGSLLEVGTGFHPELTGRENIYLNGAILGMTRREISRKFDAIVAFAEVERFLDTPVKHFSSGMYMRLAFSVAAHLDPEILLVDEVLAVGDAVFQKKCLGKMEEVSRGDGRTVLFVSHNMNAIEGLCSTAHLLDQGRLVRSGRPAEVIDFYVRSMGGTGEIVRASSPLLRWTGLENRKALGDLSPPDDLELRLGFETGDAPVPGLHVDVALTNERGEMVLHGISRLVSRPWTLPPGARASFRYLFRSPSLAPGRYRLTVYAYTPDGVLYWGEGIDACQVSAKPYFGIAECVEEIRGAILPRFEVDLLSPLPMTRTGS
jgi:lipopolysaccharide transport system ATP-binding protein